MIYTEMTKKALKICFDAHKNQIDKSGLPYVFHPFHLAEQMDNEKEVVCALLHDVVEDTDTTFDHLINLGFDNEIIEVLRLLTHRDGVEYMDYVKDVKNNEIARKVKLADLKHNSDLTRFNPENITEKDLKRQKKYLNAITFLEE